MEYEVVDKDKGTTDGSTWETICQERKKRSLKMQLRSHKESTFDEQKDLVWYIHGKGMKTLIKSEKKEDTGHWKFWRYVYDYVGYYKKQMS